MPSPSSQAVVVQPPISGGVFRRFAFQLQPPYSAIASTDFWPFDAKTGRVLSATRPPLTPFATPGAPINMLVRLNVPQPLLLAAVNGSLFKYENSWQQVTSPSLPTGARISATPFLKKVVIATGSPLPVVYNFEGNAAANLTASEGTVPAGATITTSWQGSLWLAGIPDNPQQFYASRAGDETDWDFTAEDAGGAFSAVGENEGLIGEAITALAVHTADTMVVGTRDSLWAVRGHPRRGGILELLSNNVGILGQGAFTRGPGDQLFIMSKQGLVVLLPQVGAIPTLISKEKLPDELIGLPFNSLNHTINMEYDSRWNCIYITVRGTQEQAWLYDLDQGGLFQMTFDEYPITMERFDPLTTNETSPVLFGGAGYGGLAHFNTQGLEEVTSPPRQLIGPIRISQSANYKSLITEATHVLGEEMLAGSGEVNIYCGSSAQRAAEDALVQTGVTSYSISSDNVIANGGTTKPLVAGHAAVIELVADNELANPFVYEQTTLAVRAAGRSQNTRMGQPPAFVAPTSGYARLIPVVPNSTLVDFTFLFDMAQLPEAWWNFPPRADGGDIRVSNASNVLIPADLVEFNRTARTGLLVFKVTRSATPTHIRVWAGSPTTTLPAPSDPEGQFNAYDSSTRAFYPFGGGEDRTSNGRDLTMTGSPTVGGAAGPIGNTATLFNGTTQYGQFLASTSFTYPQGLSGWYRPDVTGVSSALAGVAFTNSGATNAGTNNLRCRSFSDNRITVDIIGSASNASALSGNANPTGQYAHFANRYLSNADRRVYLKGNLGQQGRSTTTVSFSSFPDSIIVAAFPRATPVSEFFDGSLSLLMFHSGDRVQEYFRYQASMQDQLSFYGTPFIVQSAYPF